MELRLGGWGRDFFQTEGVDCRAPRGGALVGVAFWHKAGLEAWSRRPGSEAGHAPSPEGGAGPAGSEAEP